MKSRFPVIVGFGGYNAAGRSSFHHGFRRTVLESMDSRARQETLAGLAVMMKLVRVVDGAYQDQDGKTLSLSEIDTRFAEQILASAADPSGYDEVVFCGYGEPVIRLKELLEVGKQLKTKGAKRIRLNTNGHGNLIHRRSVARELLGTVDELSVSLNTPNAQQYLELCRPSFGLKTYEAIKDFIRESRDAGMNVSATVVAMPGVDTVLAMIGLATVSTALAYLLFFRILAGAGATNISLVTFLIPPSAILLGILFLGETLLPRHVAGLALIGLGLALVDGRLMRRRRQAV